jgi:hypothetical protein
MASVLDECIALKATIEVDTSGLPVIRLERSIMTRTPSQIIYRTGSYSAARAAADKN